MRGFSLKKSSLSSFFTLSFSILFLSYLYLPNFALAQTTPIFVQSAGSNGSTSVTFPNSVGQGNLLIAVTRRGDGGSSSVTGITDNKGNIWQLAKSQIQTGDNTLSVWYAMNANSGATTVTQVGGSGSNRWAVLEYSGVATTSALSQSNSQGNTTSSSPNSGSIATTGENELVFSAAGVSNSRSFTAGSGFTERLEVNNKISTEDRVATLPGSVSGTWSLNSSDTWSAIVVSFKSQNETPLPPDTTNPSVSITSPVNGQNISGVVTVLADASDNIGVAGVQFKLDGSNLGSEDTTSPYNTSWNTASTTNGSHTLLAVARDAAGNVSTSTPVAITVSNTAPSGDLLVHLKFDESSGTLAFDSSGNANHATLSNGPTFISGKIGNALKLDGVNDYGTIGDLDIYPALSVSVWINQPTAISGWGSVIMKRYTYGFEVNGSTISFGIGNGSVWSREMTAPIALGEWQHFVGVYDGTNVTLYKNGAQVSAPQPATLNNSNTPLLVGSWTGSSEFFNGHIDDVRIYNRALTSSEIANLYSGTTSPDTITPTVSISSPQSNSTVQDFVTISANASDNVGVAGVQFKLDGVNLDSEDTVSPYSINWNTRQTANGNHAITAVARDFAGNTATSLPVIVSVNNTAGGSGFQNEIIVTDLFFPTTLEFLPDGSMVVGELTGAIKRVLPGQSQAEATPFMTITNIGNAGGLQGLMDIELDPNFATNRYFYVFYTLGSPNVDRVSRFTASTDFSSASLSSEFVIYQDTLSAGTDHHGGALVFGNDGKLYITTGEHFNTSYSQNLSSSRGKVLRYNSDGTVPTDNPFYDGAGSNYDAIWAYGFRNPFRMTVDKPTGRIFVADVGGNNYSTAREEVNLLSRGANYSWPNCEGICGVIDPGDPIYSYSHFVSGSSGPTRDASITGGIVYRGNQFPSEYVGNYFFGDYTQNWIRRLVFDSNNNLIGMQPFEPADGSTDGPYGAVVHLIEGPEGALYYTDIGWENESVFTGGKIRRIRYNSGNLAPIVSATGTPLFGPEPLTVNFSSSGTSDPEGQPLSYVWDFGDNLTSTSSNPVHTYAEGGQYTARLTVSDGVLTSVSNPIIVQVGTPPVASINLPLTNSTFRAGDIITFSGSATDTEDGVLPASSYSWQFLFHHNTHVHPTLPFNGIISGTFPIEESGHDYSGNTRYEIVLTVTDSNGLQDTESVFVYPEKVDLTFNSLPDSGLSLKIDGINRTTPFVLDTLVNFHHTIEAPDQSLGSSQYTFDSWSQGGAQTQTLIVPETNQTYYANFNVATTSLNLGILAHLKFDESSGTLASDSSGNNWNATLINGPIFAAGRFGNSLSFDGSNDYGSIGDLDLPQAFSISLWIKQPSSLPSWGSVFMKRFTYGFEVNGSTAYFSIGNGSNWSREITTPITLNQWQHLVGVYNNGQVSIYRDGAQVGVTQSGTLTNSNVPLLIGSWTGSDQFFAGQIDDVRVYNRALSSAEIIQLFQQ